jgi:hypothetical protein
MSSKPILKKNKCEETSVILKSCGRKLDEGNSLSVDETTLPSSLFFSYYSIDGWDVFTTKMKRMQEKKFKKQSLKVINPVDRRKVIKRTPDPLLPGWLQAVNLAEELLSN